MDGLKWKGTGVRWTLEKAQNVGLVELMRMNTQQRAELAQFYRNQFVNRTNQFARVGRVGYALAKVIKDFSDVNSKLGTNFDPFDPVVETHKGMRQLAHEFDRKNPQNSLASYISVMQDFFKAKSSTVKGWDAIGLAQDKRLFGMTVERTGKFHWDRDENGNYVLDENGKRIKVWETVEIPTYTMTDAERIMFWRVYEEVRKSGWTSINDYSSESQHEFATRWMAGDFNKTDFAEAYDNLRQMLSQRPKGFVEHAEGIEGDFFQRKGGGDDFSF